MHRYTELRSLQDRHLPSAPMHVVPRPARPGLGRRLLTLLRRDAGTAPAPAGAVPPPHRPGRRLAAPPCDSEPDWC